MSENSAKAAQLLARLQELKQEVERKKEFLAQHTAQPAVKADDSAVIKEKAVEKAEVPKQPTSTVHSVDTPKKVEDDATVRTARKEPSSTRGQDEPPKKKKADEETKHQEPAIAEDDDELARVLSTFRELLAVSKEASTEGFASKVDASSISDGEEYESLRHLVAQLSAQLEQEARKVALAWKGSKSDKEARSMLLRCMVQPAERIVTALSTISASTRIIQVLRAAAAARAADVCKACIALIDGLETKPLPPLAGAVEAVCENIRKLPVSNAAAFKRFALEQAKTLSDTQAEFEEIAESGMVDWGLPEDDDDFENEEDDEPEEIDAEDKNRIELGTQTIAKLKSLVIVVGNIQKLGPDEYDTICERLTKCLTAATDFGVELYPPHDNPRVIQKATILGHSVASLSELLSSNEDFARALADFQSNLNLLVV